MNTASSVPPWPVCPECGSALALPPSGGRSWLCTTCGLAAELLDLGPCDPADDVDDDAPDSWPIGDEPFDPPAVYPEDWSFRVWSSNPSRN